MLEHCPKCGGKGTITKEPTMPTDPKPATDKLVAWAVCNRDGEPVLWTIRELKREAVAVWMVDYNQKFADDKPLDWKDSKNRLGTKIGCVTIKRIRDNVAELLSQHIDLMNQFGARSDEEFRFCGEHDDNREFVRLAAMARRIKIALNNRKDTNHAD
jgi:hypothetical protein